MNNIEHLSKRKQNLINAENKAIALFQQTVDRGWIKANISEKELSGKIHELAFEMFQTKQHWHKRIVRAGENTLQPYSQKPPNRILKEDDILFFDFGPVFEKWEADVGRTYVIGNDKNKLRLMKDVEECWSLGKTYFDSHPEITGAELYKFICNLAHERFWQFGNEHCGHLVGKFPHEKIHDEKKLNYIHPDNHLPMNANDQYDQIRDWILEIHFVDHDLKIGGFYEQLLSC
ncbi:MAG: aminopeptidase [Candidatus Marinimicrobia bacterium]|nr:aminopeptidase [Candidatus Neomarinimicrobiota bacterium]